MGETTELLPRTMSMREFAFNEYVEVIKKSYPLLHGKSVSEWLGKVVHKLNSHIAFSEGNEQAFDGCLKEFPALPRYLPKYEKKVLMNLLSFLKKSADYSEVKMPHPSGA